MIKTVWISRTGAKYHSGPDCSQVRGRRGSLYEVGTDNIAVGGRQPCQACYAEALAPAEPPPQEPPPAVVCEAAPEPKGFQPAEFAPGSRWVGAISGLEIYGVFIEIYRGGIRVGKGLIHRSRLFPMTNRPPTREWHPADYIGTTSLLEVEVIEGRDPLRLSLSTAHLDLLGQANQTAAIVARGAEAADDTPAQAAEPRRTDLLRLKGQHFPRVVISALQTAIAALGELPPDDQCTVYVEVRREVPARNCMT